MAGFTPGHDSEAAIRRPTATSLKPFTESAGRAQAGGNDPQG
jgi:hypothetical protein